ncbi:GGDEF domain-containing protein [Sulfurimonas sp.]|uniref:GGDEF domain-containing protein n=1 Tax=Sulfurimonas sp. TaxID=2022749 RepID=UPI003D0CC716
MISLYSIMAAILVVGTGYYLYENFIYRKMYYKKIIDTSSNIVMITNHEKIIEVNATFFQYFSKCMNLKEFLEKYSCLCDFFEIEEGYLGSNLEGKTWIEYLYANNGVKHKVKMNIYGHKYYFLVSASLIDPKRKVYGLIFSDISEQEQTKKALELLTLNDALTNIGNRRYFDQKLEEHITLTQRYKYPFSFLIFDIDFFKKINDMYGHDVGDKVLIEFTTLIKENLRQADIFARIGGEEFAVLLPATTNDKAYTLAQKLRTLIEEAKGTTQITTSIGLIQYEKGDDPKTMFQRADFALYKAKETGRNKVVLG